MTSGRSSARGARWLALAALLLGLSACRNDLYTKQTEADANAMVGALLENGVDAGKQTPDAGKTWSVAVDDGDVVRALAVLRAQGLPQDKHVTLGDMFKKDGLISTPTEERVRFIHGVTQELAETIGQIDGVVTARVHIVLPNNDPMASEVKPSSASVFIKYRPQANLSALTPAIKNMVARSVEGLSYDNVSVTLVPGMGVMAAAPAATSYAGWLIAAAVALLLGACGWTAWRRPPWLPEAIARRLPGVAEPAAATEAASTSGATSAPNAAKAAQAKPA